MAKRNDIKTILIMGAGPINIGQACEFDYSGTQACRVLKHTEGYRIILINSNPATFMTDHDNADVIYIKPINPYYVEEIIKIEKPDAILPTMGGQVALNCAMELVQNGTLEKYGVELIGVDYDTIQNAEDRGKFKDIVTKCGYKHAKSIIVASESDIQVALEYIGLPAIIRAFFTLGGSGGGIAYNDVEFFSKVRDALKISPVGQVQIDQSLLGWKEYELEILCDKKGNNIVVCGIENIDPVGVHTGDSITVTPCITLRDKEYQYMRDASFKILRAVGMDSGGANVQFAINPENGDCFIIEVNPRVSRSSALASKATGYPIAKVAAQLSIGYSLDEIKNDYIGISASFEPTIDYVVVKIPRFNFDKFAISQELTTLMKSVGEIMGIGRSFPEAFQKAICSLEDSFSGFNSLTTDPQKLESLLTLSLPNRYLYIADALRLGFSIDKIVELTKYEKWFVMQIDKVIECEKAIKANKDLLSAKMLWHAKKLGFSDAYLASITNNKSLSIRKVRHSLGVIPVFKAVDSCAAEFKTTSNYFYSCYEGNIRSKAECESISSDKGKVILIGSGPNRIGQGIEFDYACVHAIRAIRKLGYEAIMINCNPETVSTDYDMSDKLYFSPLIEEYILDIIDKERQSGELIGAILQFGGQTPIKLCHNLDQHGVNILGTCLDSIDLAEDRDRFNKIITELNIHQPKGTICYKISEVLDKANKLGYPVVIRPSYILGGQAMSVIYDISMMEEYLGKHKNILDTGPILIDSFLENATELDIDAISDGEEVYIAGIMEHIEDAGIHSGDSASSLPVYQLDDKVIEDLTEQVMKIVLKLKIIGLVNLQFAYKYNRLYVLEVNPRSSRTVPFIAKATGLPIIYIATAILLNKAKISDFNLKSYKEYLNGRYAVKQAIFPFKRFSDVDTLLGPEMRSTGEVMGIADTFELAFAESHIACGYDIVTEGEIFISIRNEDKSVIIDIAKEFINLGFTLSATRGTANYLRDADLKVKIVNKVREGRPHIVDSLMQKDIVLVINTSSNEQKAIADSLSIRRTALLNNIVCCTDLKYAKCLLGAIKLFKSNKSKYDILPLNKPVNIL